MNEFEYRPWGFYEVLLDEKDHKVKRITLDPGGRLSLQRHKHRSEHWCVVSGVCTVTVDAEQKQLLAGEAIDIPQGSIHRIANNGNDKLVYIEIQLGDYFGEDDIERLEDDYGRV